MIFLKCDKCQKEEELSVTFPMMFETPNGRPKFFISYNGANNPRMINLCSSCEEQLEKFLQFNK